MWDFVSVAGLVILVAIILVILAVALAYRLPPAFRFWLLDIWADFPFIGMVARLARMFKPTTERAETRLDKLFCAYHNLIEVPPPKEDHDRARKYLSLAGDSDSHPTPFFYWVLLIILMAAEAFTFSFLLGISISPDISERQADVLGVVFAVIMAALFAALSHPAGHAIRRTHALRAAYGDAIDPDVPLRGEDEKSIKVLTECVDLEDSQDRDEAVHYNFESQRLLNRVRKEPNDRGSYVLPVLFILVIIASGVLQYTLRSGSSLVSQVLELPDSGMEIGQNTPVSANTFFVLIFFLTQALALYMGYKYGFLGKDSKRAYRRIGGRDTHRDHTDEYNRRVRRADESLTSLYTKYRVYRQISPKKLDYRQRLELLSKPPEQDTVVPPSPPAPMQAETNVRQLPTTKNGSAA